MKTMYQVRIADGLRRQFINDVPWGSQGPIIEALMRLLLERGERETLELAVAKLLDGRYKLIEFVNKDVPSLEIDDAS